MTKRKLPPLHPGEILREEFLIPLELSAGALAKVCGVPRTRIERLANEAAGVTADTALRLSKAFGTTAALWLNLQNDYDIRMAQRDIGKELDKIEPVIERAAWRSTRRTGGRTIASHCFRPASDCEAKTTGWCCPA
jgi:addiction module HigA family antidote